MTESLLSTAPNGESFPLPKQEDYAKEYKRLQTLVKKHRKEGREIVVVMGVGFVGAVMAGIVADAVQKETGVATTVAKSENSVLCSQIAVGRPTKFVIGKGKTGATPLFPEGKMGSCTGFSPASGPTIT